MRHELPSLHGAFRTEIAAPADVQAGPPFDPAFVIVMAVFAVGIVICIAGLLFA